MNGKGGRRERRHRHPSGDHRGGGRSSQAGAVALVATLVEAMTFVDALAATTGVVPITRAMEKGWLMIGYLDGSVSITKDQRLIRRFPRGTGPTLGYTDWQPGGER